MQHPSDTAGKSWAFWGTIWATFEAFYLYDKVAMVSQCAHHVAGCRSPQEVCCEAHLSSIIATPFLANGLACKSSLLRCTGTAEVPVCPELTTIACVIILLS